MPQIDKTLVSDELDEILSVNPDDETQESCVKVESECFVYCSHPFQFLQ